MANITFPVPSCFEPDPPLDPLDPVLIECLDLQDLRPSDLKPGGRVVVVQLYPKTATCCSGQYGSFQVLNGLGGQIHRALFLGASANAFGTAGLVSAGGPEVDVPAVEVPVDCSDTLTGDDKALAVRDRGRWYVVRLGAKLPKITIPASRVVLASVVGGNNDPYEGRITTTTRDSVQVETDVTCKYSTARHYIFAQHQRQFPSGPPQPQTWSVAGTDLAILPEAWQPGDLFPASNNKRLPDGLGFACIPPGKQQAGTLFGFPAWGQVFALQYDLLAPRAAQVLVRTGYPSTQLLTTAWVVFDKPITSPNTPKCHITIPGITTVVNSAQVLQTCVLEIQFSAGSTVPASAQVQISLDAGAVASSAGYGSVASAAGGGTAVLQEPAVVDYGLYVGAAQDRDRLKRVTNTNQPPLITAACWVRDDPTYLEVYFDCQIQNLSPSVAPAQFVVLGEGTIQVTGVAVSGNKAILSLSASLSSTSPVWVWVPPAYANKAAPDQKMVGSQSVQAYVAEARTSIIPVYYADAIDGFDVLRYGDQVEIDMASAVHIEDLDKTGTRSFYQIKTVRPSSAPVPVGIIGGNVPSVSAQVVGIADAVLYSAADPVPPDWGALALSAAPAVADFVSTARPPAGLGVAIVTGGTIWNRAYTNTRDRCVWVTNRLLLRAVFAADAGQAVLPRLVYDDVTPANRAVVWDLL